MLPIYFVSALAIKGAIVSSPLPLSSHVPFLSSQNHYWPFPQVGSSKPISLSGSILPKQAVCLWYSNPFSGCRENVCVLLAALFLGRHLVHRVEHGYGYGFGFGTSQHTVYPCCSVVGTHRFTVIMLSYFLCHFFIIFFPCVTS